MRETIRTTLLGGVLFLVPLVIVVVVVGKAFQIMKVVALPLDKYIPMDTFAGFAVVELLTGLMVFLSCLVAGIIAKAEWAGELHAKLDKVLLQLVPGYSWLKGVTGEISDDEADRNFEPVLVKFDDQSQIGFKVDEMPGDLIAVFLPGSPDPRSGVLSYVTRDRLQPLQANFKDVSGACRRLGVGTSDMLAARRAKE